MSTFRMHLSWEGSTATPDFTRNAGASSEGKPLISVGTGLGDGASPARWNPEDLLGASLAQCHNLTFLALASKVRLDVRRIETEVTLELVTEEKRTRVGKITLAPTITVAAGTDVAKTAEMYEKAHKYCYIGNSLNSEITMVPTVIEG